MNWNILALPKNDVYVRYALRPGISVTPGASKKTETPIICYTIRTRNEEWKVYRISKDMKMKIMLLRSSAELVYLLLQHQVF